MRKIDIIKLAMWLFFIGTILFQVYLFSQQATEWEVQRSARFTNPAYFDSTVDLGTGNVNSTEIADSTIERVDIGTTLWLLIEAIVGGSDIYGLGDGFSIKSKADSTQYIANPFYYRGTFADGDATPSVTDTCVFITANTSRTIYTAFDNSPAATKAKLILVYINDGHSEFQDNDSNFDCGIGDLRTRSGDWVMGLWSSTLYKLYNLTDLHHTRYDTLTINSETPALTNATRYICKNTSATTLKNFTSLPSATERFEFEVLFLDDSTTVNDSSTVLDCHGVDLAPDSSDFMVFRWDFGKLRAKFTDLE